MEVIGSTFSPAGTKVQTFKAFYAVDAFCEKQFLQLLIGHEHFHKECEYHAAKKIQINVNFSEL